MAGHRRPIGREVLTRGVCPWRAASDHFGEHDWGEIAVSSWFIDGSQMASRLFCFTWGHLRMPTEQLSRTDARRACILVVDDEPLVAALMADTLGLEGYEVETAKNGREALEKIATRSYDAVLSDLRMPELDGVGLLSQT